ncbi:MAG: hypothetical protein HC875_19130 [Anaerolineales bacterium]|nr:hypothetical protein [Anaerolineales bacterium]
MDENSNLQKLLETLVKFGVRKYRYKDIEVELGESPAIPRTRDEIQDEIKDEIRREFSKLSDDEMELYSSS